MDYQARDPLRVEPEPTDQPGRTAYRLHITAGIPAEISLITGDVLHNLRLALDSLVFGIVQDDLGRELLEDEERSCQFPIVDDPPSFDDFFKQKWRNKIMSPGLRRVLRSVQPFYGLEYLRSLGKATDCVRMKTTALTSTCRRSTGCRTSTNTVALP